MVKQESSPTPKSSRGAAERVKVEAHNRLQANLVKIDLIDFLMDAVLSNPLLTDAQLKRMARCMRVAMQSSGLSAEDVELG